MGTKQAIWIGMAAGSFLGGLIPSIWDHSLFSFSSLLWSTAGAIVGIYVAFKLTR